MFYGEVNHNLRICKLRYMFNVNPILFAQIRTVRMKKPTIVIIIITLIEPL